MSSGGHPTSRLRLGAELRAGEGRLEVTVDAPTAQGARSTTRSTINMPLPVTHITLGDGDQLTLSEPRAVRHGRAGERADQDAGRPFRTRSYGSAVAPGHGVDAGA